MLPLWAILIGTLLGSQLQSNVQADRLEDEQQHGWAPGRNFGVSPLGASLALSMLTFGARGSSASELHRSLGLPASKEVKEKELQRIVDDLQQNYSAVGLKIANGVFLSSRFKAKKEFRGAIIAVFDPTIDTINFENIWQSRKAVNAWSSLTTHNGNEIDIGAEPISSRDRYFESTTAFVVVNALDFKGKWLHKFEASQTEDEEFTCSKGGRRKIAMMKAEVQLFRGKCGREDFKFIELPYMTEDADHPVSMFIILPMEPDNFYKLDHCVFNITMEQVLKKEKLENSTMKIPKFKFYNEWARTGDHPIYYGMGLRDVYKRDRANFSGIFSNRSSEGQLPPLYISEIVHKTFIEVTEEGITAAAVTESKGTCANVQDFGYEFDYAPDTDCLLPASRSFHVMIGTTGAHPLKLFAARVSAISVGTFSQVQGVY